MKKIPAAKTKTRTNGAKIGIFGGRRARSILEYTSIFLRIDLRISAFQLSEYQRPGMNHSPEILRGGIAQTADAKEKSHSLAVDFSAVGVILVLRFFVVRAMRSSSPRQALRFGPIGKAANNWRIGDTRG